MNETFDGFVVLRNQTPLGHGQYATVWRACGPRGATLACKEIVFGRLRGDREMLRRQALREATVHADLSHPNIVRVHHAVHDVSRVMLFMDCCPHTLEDLIVSRGG